MNRASTWDPELEEQVGAAVSRQEKAAGITQILAPVLDISRDSRMGRQGKPTARIRPWRRRWERPTPGEFRRASA